MNCQKCNAIEFTEKTSKGFLIKVCKKCKLTQFYHIGHNGIKTKLASKDPKLWAEFMEFWNMYPNHKGGSMEFVFEKCYIPNPVDINKFKIILPLQIAEKKKKGFEMPMAKTYLNQKRWQESPKDYGYTETDYLKTVNFQIRKVKKDYTENFISKQKADELLQNIKKEALSKGFKIKDSGFEL